MNLLHNLMIKKPTERYSAEEAMNDEAFDILFEVDLSYDYLTEREQIFSRRKIIDSNKQTLKSYQYSELVHGNISETDKSKYNIGCLPVIPKPHARKSSQISQSKFTLTDAKDKVSMKCSIHADTITSPVQRLAPHHPDIPDSPGTPIDRIFQINGEEEIPSKSGIGTPALPALTKKRKVVPLKVLGFFGRSSPLDGELSARFSIVTHEDTASVSHLETKDRRLKNKYSTKSLGRRRVKGFKCNKANKGGSRKT